MNLFGCIAMILAQANAELPSWSFASDEARHAWTPNAQIVNVRVEHGALACDTIASDPFFTCAGLSIDATARQCVVVRLRADKPGVGELFWTDLDSGPSGGFDWRKATRFSVQGAGQWENIVIFPFWQQEGVVRKLRLDLYGNAHFAIDSLRVVPWGDVGKINGAASEWTFDSDAAWRIVPESTTRAIPISLPAAGKSWVVARIKSDREGAASIFWGMHESRGTVHEDFSLRGDGLSHYYNIETGAHPEWKGTLAVVGVRLPEGATIESLALANVPGGPAECAVEYFGAESGLNRAGAMCRVLLQLMNRGGSTVDALSAALQLPEGWKYAEGSGAVQTLSALAGGERTTLAWTVFPSSPGDHPITAAIAGHHAPPAQTATISITPALGLPKADYVPAPQPVRPILDVMAYYFPGWDTPEKWDPIRHVAPIRRPLLGYYDEGKAEVVDWQIKWAVEHGITGFLVDWYWNKGDRMLEHWFGAYRNARYRDQLKVAIMWANHWPAGQHSPEDWRKVTQHWLEHYFTLPGYYRIDGKPAVFIWDTAHVRSDLGGSNAVRAVFEESQKAAQAKGFPGILYVAIGNEISTDIAATLAREGYSAYTRYHEWGSVRDEAEARSLSPLSYDTVVQSATAAWARQNAARGGLTYYPTVDTGWDNRPWEGSRAYRITGRTPALFKQLLQQAKEFCAAEHAPMVVIGPLNEWGEGSYIEPCTEFGFAMYDRIREVFGTGDPALWPANIAPADVGLGPYDFPTQTGPPRWTFDSGLEGWSAHMNVVDMRNENGALRFRTISSDPALTISSVSFPANEATQCTITMRFTGTLPPHASGQLYWGTDGAAPSETTSARFFLEHDGQSHSYTIDLSKKTLWRGTVTALRLDPCETAGIDVAIDEVRFDP